MPFNRPPRIQPTLSKETVKIPPPPALPQEPSAFSWMTIMIPLGGILLMVILMGALGGGGGGMMYLLTMPMMLGGYVVTYYSFRNQKKEFQKKLADGKREYSLQLKKPITICIPCASANKPSCGG